MIYRYTQAKEGGNVVPKAIDGDLLKAADIMFELDHWYILGNTKGVNIWSQRLGLQTTCMAHNCEHFKNIQYLDEVDALAGRCWWCQEIAPDEVQALWRLLNTETLPEMIQRFSGGCS
jgi:hypothetical protein